MYSNTMKTITTMANVGTHKQGVWQLLLGLFGAVRKHIRNFFWYIRYVFRPAKKLRPEVQKEIERMAERSDDVSPVFTTTEDAAKWLNSRI